MLLHVHPSIIPTNSDWDGGGPERAERAGDARARLTSAFAGKSRSARFSGVHLYHDMPRKVKFVPTPSRLSEILKVLNQEPKPILSKVKGLKITYAYRNDHWGARCVCSFSALRRNADGWVLDTLCRMTCPGYDM